jgi:segregation and condensation protein A
LAFEIELEEFSGPLDLLCRLVETGEIQASRIQVSDLIRTYSSYLLHEKALPFRAVSEFIALTARLLLGKVRGLFPQPSTDSGLPPETAEENPNELLRAAIERYRPFRKAAAVLVAKLEERQKFQVRKVEEDSRLYDYGDLFSLSRLWWELLASKSSVSNEREDLLTDEMLGFETLEPDFLLVERKMVELEDAFKGKGRLSFRFLFKAGTQRRTFVVTLLALLELARQGKVKIYQEDPFGDPGIQFC